MNEELIKKSIFVKKQIRKLYLEKEKYPWIIGYSGGKDSTLVVQLVFESLTQMKEEGYKLERPVYVLMSDTLIENPVIHKHQVTNLEQMKERGCELNIYVKKVLPRLTDSFWVNVIGKGYPVPLQYFRWCTSRLKINPIALETKKISNEYEKALVFIGSRKGESLTRDRVLKKYLDSENMSKHPEISYAIQYSPIADFSLEDVWMYLFENSCPWEKDLNNLKNRQSLNQKLFRLYEESSMDFNECPWTLDFDINSKSCGKSRWGCWACTVISEDKSLKMFCKNGNSWVKSLVDFRAKIKNERNIRRNRYLGGLLYKNDKVYLKKHTMKMSKILKDGEEHLLLKPLLGREEILISINSLTRGETEYNLIDYNKYKDIPIQNFFNDDNLYNTIVKIDDENYRIIGVGGYTLEYRKQLLRELSLIQEELKDYVTLITKEEIIIIKDFWKKTRSVLEGDIDV